jgi:hypothetical protein
MPSVRVCVCVCACACVCVSVCACVCVCVCVCVHQGPGSRGDRTSARAPPKLQQTIVITNHHVLMRIPDPSRRIKHSHTSNPSPPTAPPPTSHVMHLHQVLVPGGVEVRLGPYLTQTPTYHTNNQSPRSEPHFCSPYHIPTRIIPKTTPPTYRPCDASPSGPGTRGGRSPSRAIPHPNPNIPYT